MADGYAAVFLEGAGPGGDVGVPADLEGAVLDDGAVFTAADAAAGLQGDELLLIRGAILLCDVGLALDGDLFFGGGDSAFLSDQVGLAVILLLGIWLYGLTGLIG